MKWGFGVGLLLIATACGHDYDEDQALDSGADSESETETEIDTGTGYVSPFDTGAVRPMDTGAGIDTDTLAPADTGEEADSDTPTEDQVDTETDTPTIEPGVDCAPDYCLGQVDQCWKHRCTTEACVDEIPHKNLTISNWCQNVPRVCASWTGFSYTSDVIMLLPGYYEMEPKCRAYTSAMEFVQLRGTVHTAQCVQVRVHGPGRYVGYANAALDDPPETCKRFELQGESYQIVVDNDVDLPGWVEIRVENDCKLLEDC